MLYTGIVIYAPALILNQGGDAAWQCFISLEFQSSEK